MPMPTPSSQHPPVGTLIDNGSLELVEILGVGGYGVVYRAIDTRSPRPRSYAVKCLLHTHISRQRQAHIREIALHQIASAHPNVVTLHRVIEQPQSTFIIMDFATDGDLFSQILHNCRYLGDDYIIKRVFLQLLDAVEYCHSLGIYHRDLKPENILCFDDGMRVAITDFGLATTDKVSDEFRTGSIYHMSPECHGGEFSPSGTYSPMYNDIWSLGIVLINLATGRNPWRSASSSDPTFHAYTRDPENFLTTVLPLSSELNALLTRMLDLDPRKRISLPELREAMEDIETFYADTVIFEGSMARCQWEAGMDIDAASTMKDAESEDSNDADSLVHIQTPHSEDLKSHWSKESTSDIVFAGRSNSDESTFAEAWRHQVSCSATYAINSEGSSSSGHAVTGIHYSDQPLTPPPSHSGFSSYHSYEACPATPGNFDPTYIHHVDPKQSLKVETGYRAPLYYNGGASFSTVASSGMHTAVDAYDSSIFVATPASAVMKSPTSDYGHFAMEDQHMQSPSTWHFASSEESEPSLYSTSPSSLNHQSMNSRNFLHEPVELPFWSELHIQNSIPLPEGQESLNPVESVMTAYSEPPISSIPSSFSPAPHHQLVLLPPLPVQLSPLRHAPLRPSKNRRPRMGDALLTRFHPLRLVRRVLSQLWMSGAHFRRRERRRRLRLRRKNDLTSAERKELVPRAAGFLQPGCFLALAHHEAT